MAQEGTFAAACVSMCSIGYLQTVVVGEPDKSDMLAWGLTEDQWRSEILLAIRELILDTVRVFKGSDTGQCTYEGEEAKQDGWYWEPADYEGDGGLWSDAFATREQAETAAIDWYHNGCDVVHTYRNDEDE